jgi:hypothetical protein
MPSSNATLGSDLDQFLSEFMDVLASEGSKSDRAQQMLAQAGARDPEWRALAETALELRRRYEEDRTMSLPRPRRRVPLLSRLVLASNVTLGTLVTGFVIWLAPTVQRFQAVAPRMIAAAENPPSPGSAAPSPPATVVSLDAKHLSAEELTKAIENSPRLREEFQTAVVKALSDDSFAKAVAASPEFKRELAVLVKQAGPMAANKEMVLQAFTEFVESDAYLRAQEKAFLNMAKAGGGATGSPRIFGDAIRPGARDDIELKDVTGGTKRVETPAKKPSKPPM